MMQTRAPRWLPGRNARCITILHTTRRCFARKADCPTALWRARHELMRKLLWLQRHTPLRAQLRHHSSHQRRCVAPLSEAADSPVRTRLQRALGDIQRSDMGHANKRRKLGSESQTAAAAVTVEPGSYASQLSAKALKVRELFSDTEMPELDIFESIKEHYRLRAEFRVWQSAEDIFYIMFERAEGAKAQGEWERQRVDTFPVACKSINELMSCVMDNIRDVWVLRQKLFQANFHATLSGDAMVTLVYHKPLDAAWEEAASKLREQLRSRLQMAEGTVSLIGRSKNKKFVLGADYVTEEMEVDGRRLFYKQVEGIFSQPNGFMCCKMLEWARAVTRGSQGGDLLELYCGSGNFTIALADNFREVFATEVSKAAVAAAKDNLASNRVTNVHIARLSSEEFVQAWQGQRDFFRMKGLPPIENRHFQTLLVDPPRAGLDEQTAALLPGFDSIVYISCNPVTLQANLRRVADSHRIERFALFDQFPYTEHIECGVYLTKKK